MADFFQQCGAALAAVNLAAGPVEQTEADLEQLEAELDASFAELSEECEELGNGYDDLIDMLAEVLKGLAVFPLFGNVIEIGQCLTALGDWERIGHQIEQFEARLADETAALEAAQEILEECAHKWASESAAPD